MSQPLKPALLLSFFIFTGLLSHSQEYLPTSTTNHQIIKHSYYILSYLEEHEQAEWVTYKLTSEMITGNISRTDNFRVDTDVTTGSATLVDYKGSGFDRGHLCPAGDMSFSSTAMSESFFLSNMSPQDPSFNRGIWKKLESLVRSWAGIEHEIIVVTGTIFIENKGTIGPNQVAIPGYYYKVIYDLTGEQKMIEFILPNEKSTKDLKEYAVSVDYVEELTGIDFFYELDDDKEEALESSESISDWDFNAVSTSTSSSNSSSSTSVQCKGVAKTTGQECENRTTNSNGYCHLHQNQAKAPNKVAPNSTGISPDGRCMATTQAGTRCKRKAEAGSKYCWQHKQ